jgi:trimethylamine--corrinoid protein Co-methyltransferase
MITATIAGSLVMKIAEQLAGLCLMQAIRPGSPCLFDNSQMKIDMRTSELDESGPESVLAIAAGAQLARRYGIPSYACPAPDAKIADFQAGYEMTYGLQGAMLSGIHDTVNSGVAARASAMSYELLMLHHEMLRNLLRLRRGLTVSEETLAVDVMQEVGFDGDYLEQPHTLQFMRDDEEYLHKDLYDATGIRAAYVDPCERAKERWQQLLRDHQSTVSVEEQKAIDAVVAAY